MRRLAGRYLWLRLTLAGNGQASPELAAIRVYGNRFSYRDRYLPAFYREPLGGPDAAAEGAATPHDFLDRMLGLFEGALTEIEGRIAGTWLLTDPAAAPPEALPWIGQLDRRRRRARSQSATASTEPARRAPYGALHGTLGGLLAALELATGGVVVSGGRIDPRPPGARARQARPRPPRRRRRFGRWCSSMQRGGECAMLTGGAVTRGDIVVVEGFRLRRTFATILGADLADEEDPLTLGLADFGQQLRRRHPDPRRRGARRAARALPPPRSTDSRGDSAAVEQFYARLAHRVLVLVRGVDEAAEMTRASREIVERPIPAHVEPQVLPRRATR